MKILNPQISEDLRCGVALRLDLGCGPKPKAGYYGVDQESLPRVDIQADLNQVFDQLPDNCAAAVYSAHVLEHVENLRQLLEEVHRITKGDGIIEFILPHFSNPYYYSDPTHVRFFGLYTMHYFVAPEKQPGVRHIPTHYTSALFEIESILYVFDRSTLWDRVFVKFFRFFVNRNAATQDFYERRLCWLYPATEICYRLRPQKRDSTSA